MIEEFSYYDDNICSGVICLSRNKKCIISCIYRPPTAEISSFSNLLTFLKNFIAKYNSDDQFQICIFGDFNLPKFCWNSTNLCSLSSAPSYKLFTDFLNDNFLSQFVNENTRLNNILDLFLSNNPSFIHLVKCEDIAISDHNLVKIFTDFFSLPNTKFKTEFIVSDKPDFSSLDLPKANYELINHIIHSYDWKISGQQR